MTTATILVINTGTSPNAGDGDTLRTAFNKVNYNFSLVEEQINSIVTFTGTVTVVANLGDITITGPVISTTGTNESIVLAPNGTGTVIVNGKLEPLSGIQFPNGTILTTAINTSSITVSEMYTSTGVTYIQNQVNNVTTLRFDTDAGFTVSDIGSGQAFVSMNSTFKYWVIDGEPTLIANGLDTMHFKKGTGINIISSATDVPQSIQFNLAPATTSTLGGIIVGQGLAINAQGILTATNLASTGEVVFSQTTMYPQANNLDLVISNQYATVGNYILVPAVNDNVTALTLLGQNGLLITTTTSSNAPIVISPNDDLNGPGDVQIYAQGAYDYTAGVYMASTVSQVFLYPSDVLPSLVSASTNETVGTLDLATRRNHSISIRPGGIDSSTGTVYMNGTLVVNSVNILNGSKIGNATTGTSAGGSGVTSSTYLTQAVQLNLSAFVQKLTSGAYYLPPGIEGQQVYFAPVTGATSGTNIAVWMQVIRSFSNNTASTSTNREWFPFYSSSVGLPYAIYTDGAWNLSTNNIV